MGRDSALTDLTAETACLGACLCSAEAAALVCAESRAHDYTRDAHRLVYRAIQTLLSRREPVDRVTLARALPPEVPATLVLDLEAAVPSAANVRAYLRMLTAASQRRTVTASAQRAVAAMADPEASVPEALAHLAEDIEAVACGPDGGQTILPTAVKDALRAWMAAADAGVKPVRVPTHLSALNRCLGGGLAPGRLYYLGARASVGKTSLALDIARHAAGMGHGVMIVSLEMPEVDGITTRMLAQASGVSELTMRAGLFTDVDYPRMVAGYNRLTDLPLWITERTPRLEQIVRLVERWPFTPRLDLLIVDYLQLVRGPKAESRRVEMEEISRTLKLLSVQIAAPVLCISALKRREDDTEPSMSDLKETGELEYDADGVFLLHRAFASSEAKLIVAKNKYGPPGVIELTFNKVSVTFAQATGDA